MEKRSENLKKLEEGVLKPDDHQLINSEQGGYLMDGRYHRYQLMNFDKPE